ncbi:MAG TPA: glucosaminidase domain-containing protein [Candidatus Dormibacteraeota bacterium]
MSGLLVALLLVGLEPAGLAFAADCDRSLSACSALLQQQDAAAANQTQLAGVDQQIAYSIGAIAALAQVVAQLQTQVEDQQSQIQATSARLDVLGRQVRLTQADVERRQVEVTIHQQLLYQRVRALDKSGAVSYLELLVTSSSFTQLVNRVATIDKVIGGDRRMVDELKQGRARLQGLRDQLERDRVQQQQLLDQQQRQLARLAQEQQAQRGAYAAQTALEAQLESRRQALQAEKASIGAQLQSLQADYQRQLSSLLAQRQAGGGPGGGFNIYTDLRIVPQVDAGALNAYFSGTAFAGLGPAFVNAGRRHGVNPLYLVAHAIEESAFGTSEIAQGKNNLFGIAAYDSNPNAAMSFPSFQACIDYEAQFVRRDYLDPQGAFYRGPNLNGMNVNYASDRRWASNIAAIYLTLPGGLNPV